MVGIHDRTIWFAVAQETKVLATIGVFVGFLCIYALIGRTYRMQGFMTCEVPPKSWTPIRPEGYFHGEIR
jgi:hypothetical protein